MWDCVLSHLGVDHKKVSETGLGGCWLAMNCLPLCLCKDGDFNACIFGSLRCRSWNIAKVGDLQRFAFGATVAHGMVRKEDKDEQDIATDFWRLRQPPAAARARGNCTGQTRFDFSALGDEGSNGRIAPGWNFFTLSHATSHSVTLARWPLTWGTATPGQVILREDQTVIPGNRCPEQQPRFSTRDTATFLTGFAELFLKFPTSTPGPGGARWWCGHGVMVCQSRSALEVGLTSGSTVTIQGRLLGVSAFPCWICPQCLMDGYWPGWSSCFRCGCARPRDTGFWRRNWRTQEAALHRKARERGVVSTLEMVSPHV